MTTEKQSVENRIRMDNSYSTKPFLESIFQRSDFDHRAWVFHQAHQRDYLAGLGISGASRILDLGCGPLRLGSVLVPELTTGWYYGADLNADALKMGEERLLSLCPNADRYTLIQTASFDLAAVKAPLDMAFSNSLFTHLSPFSVGYALKAVRQKLELGSCYYSSVFLVPETHNDSDPYARNKWGREFETYYESDPYHCKLSLFQGLAARNGFSVSIDDSYDHPTQTMLVFKSI